MHMYARAEDLINVVKCNFLLKYEYNLYSKCVVACFLDDVLLAKIIS